MTRATVIVELLDGTTMKLAGTVTLSSSGELRDRKEWSETLYGRETRQVTEQRQAQVTKIEIVSWLDGQDGL